MTFLFDHLENLFLWREISGTIGSLEPRAAWSFHGLKWLTGLVGGLIIIISLAWLLPSKAKSDERRTP